MQNAFQHKINVIMTNSPNILLFLPLSLMIGGGGGFGLLIRGGGGTWSASSLASSGGGGGVVDMSMASSHLIMSGCGYSH